jgi:signal transduction histidine kinase
MVYYDIDSVKKLNGSVPKKWRISIGTKFLILTGVLIGTTLTFFLVNAAHLFKKDNLDSIYLSSDILTSAKAGEVKTWFEGTLVRVKAIADKVEITHDSFALDGGDILIADVYEIPNEIPTSATHAPASLVRTGSWVSSTFVKTNLSATELQAEVQKMIFSDFGSAVRMKGSKHLEHLMEKIIVRSLTAQFGKGLILLGLPRLSKDNQIQFAGVVLSTDGITEIFSKTGPYMFSLLDDHGRIVVSTEGAQDLNPSEMAALPIVKRLLTTHLDRELQEFSYKDQVYLGAYQRLGVAGLSVLSQVSKSIALETGQTLIRRSILIGLLLFLGAFIFTYLFVQKLIDPILKLRNAAKQMALGNFNVRVDVSSRDEIFDLAASFNSMSAELELKIRNLYRINEASGKIRSINNNGELLDFSVDFLMSLLSCDLGLGVFFAGKKDPVTGKPKVFYSKKNWPNSTISLKKLIASLAQTKGITQCWIDDLPFLVCPIFHQDLLAGIIILGGRQAKKEFLPEEHFMARTVISMVSADSENIQYQGELKELNADLENRVIIRTEQLATANVQLKEQKKELDDVMNNIQQGILTVSDQQIVNTDYSKYTNTLFGLEEIANLNICALLYPAPEHERERENLREWLASIFLDPSIFESIQDFGLRELEFARKQEDGTPELRFLSFQWRPIYEEEQIIKIMLVCFDLTEQKRLEREIVKQEESHKEELEIIAKLVNNPVEVIEQFISDFSRNLTAGMEVFVGLQAAFEVTGLNSLMRILHTIKGSAKQFGLESVQSKASTLEEEVSAWTRAMPPVAEVPALIEKTQAQFKVIEETLQRMIAVYEKVMKAGSGGSANAGEGISRKPMVSIPLEKFETLLKGEGETQNVKKTLALLLQTPIAPLFHRLEKLALTLTQELQYETQIVIKGEETQIDLRLLPTLYDALLHVIRNSIDHGGQLPDERVAQGKNGAIAIEMAATALPGGQIKVSIADDGKGINDQVVLKRAVEKGLVDPAKAEQLSHQEIILLIFQPGFSTKEVVTDISGRGVGMDVVKDTVERVLKGKLQVSSALGQGTKIEFVFQG